MTDIATQPETAVDTQNADAQPAAEPRNDMAALYPDDVPDTDAPATEEQQEGEQQPDPQDEPEEQPEEPEPEGDPIPAPASWAKDYKAEFEALPRQMQEVISKRETERDRFVQAKAQEVVTEKRRIEQEAQQVILQVYQAQADQLAQYASQMGAEEPDLRLLQSNDPAHHALYYQQDREYRIATAQREEAQQESQNARLQAEALEEQSRGSEQMLALDSILEKRSEVSDQSSRAKLTGELWSIAKEFGYSVDDFKLARQSDINALNVALNLKRTAEENAADAKKYRDMQKMIPVRAAKQINPVARSSAPIRQSPPKSIAQSLYPND